MYLPDYVLTALNTLREHGAQGFAVGGCVRDALLGRGVNDYDIAVNVPPERTAEIFSGRRVIGTGLKHGTVTAVIDGHNLEVTSFRTDGAYTDLRRPDSVRFTPELSEDLARRDFTVNAMAYSPETGLTDLFGGREDLKKRVIRCVGDPDTRFNEDALRILRALRFASVLGFEIEPQTERSIRENAGNLTHVSAERVFAELKKLLAGENAEAILRGYREVLEVVLPPMETVPAAAYEAAAAAAGRLREPTLSFAAFTVPLGAEAAGALCRSLKTDNRFRNTVCFLISRRNTACASPGEARRFLGEYGKEKCALLLRFQAECGTPDALLAAVCEEKQTLPTRLNELKVSGADAAALGLAGPGIGKAMEALLQKAAAGEVPNARESLLNELRLLSRAQPDKE